MLPQAFDAFIQKRPIGVMAQAVLENFFQPERLDALFERTAQRQYQRTLLFSSVIELMQSSCWGLSVGVCGLSHRRHAIGVSDEAVYNKLDGMELGISAALVQDSAQQAAAVIDALKARRDPWLPNYRCGFSMATICRPPSIAWRNCAPLGRSLAGKSWSCWNGRPAGDRRVSDARWPCAERSLLDDVLEVVKEGDLWIADRNFCTLKFLFEIARKLASLSSVSTVRCGALTGKRRFVGVGSTGDVYQQKLRLAYEGKTLLLRRVTVELKEPTRDGDRELHLLTNLPRKDATGVEVAELYRKRWTIETLFLEVTQTLSCEIKTLCYPKRRCCVLPALVAANAVAVIKGRCARSTGEKAMNCRAITWRWRSAGVRGMMIALPPPSWRSSRT